MSTVLDVKELSVHYETSDGAIKAVNNLSFSMEKGCTLGIVGETGAGKTTLAKSIMRILPSPLGVIKSGQIIYGGRDLLLISPSEMCDVRGKQISMIFQDPMTSLNPVITVEKQIAEVIEAHAKISATESLVRARKMLETVNIPFVRGGDYPHQFSGGMKQRVIIAIAMACNPNLLLADEPTTALDVTIQTQILAMIRSLRDKIGTSVILITHDLGVVAQNCDYVAIVYAGEIVEYGDVKQVFKSTGHPYTIGLLSSIPKLNEDVERLKPIDGLIPDPMALPEGCFFSTRCKYACNKCYEEHPVIQEVSPGHTVRCWNFGRLRGVRQ